MATINAPTLAKPQYSGDSPLASAPGAITFAAHPIATRVRLVKLPAGSKIIDFRAVFEALGLSTTIALGTEGVDSGTAAPNALLAATATNAAGNARMGTAPLVLTEDAYIIATVGGAAATGKLDVIPTYIPE